MTEAKANRVRELRAGKIIHSWRRLSEIICDEFKDEPKSLRGNQLHGIDLCREAMALLYGDGDLKKVPEKIREEWDT